MVIFFEMLVFESFLLFLLGIIIFGGLFERFKIEVEWFLFILKFEREYIFLYIVL